MLREPLHQGLQDLGLRGMARAFDKQTKSPDLQAMTFEERLGFLIDHERSDRMSYRLTQRLRWAKLPQNAAVEDLDQRASRGLDRGLWARLVDLGWVQQSLNLFVCGPTGVGKSYIACALGHAACRQDLSVRYLRLPRLVEELLKAEALQKKSTFFRQLAKAKLLVIDDFGLAPLADQTKRDLLEILDDRYAKASTIITSQLPVEKWHAYIDEPTLADAILDRLVHNAHRINLTGDSMRKRRAPSDRA